MKYSGLLTLLLVLSACTHDLQSKPELAPLPPTTQTVFLPSPVECVEMVEITSTPELATVRTTVRTKLKPAQHTPTQLVVEAQKEARVQPEQRGYFGGSAEYTYTWQPGKVYVVYLSPKQVTGIFLPPGEQMVVGLLLDKEAYEVKNERAGLELAAYDALSVQPLIDKGEVDTFILTTSGRRYLFHFVVGSTAMLAVTFETPHVTQATPDSRLVLPKPTP